jgi:hypothetical protein
MKKIAGLFVVILTGVLDSYAMPVAVDTNQLIKVTDTNKEKCVEYYDYKGGMYCSTKAFSTAPVDPKVKNYETQKIQFDSRPWIAAWGENSDTIAMVEYVPKGDDINKWKELVTSQFFPGLASVSPRAYADQAMKGMTEAGFKPVIKYYDDNAKQILFEFQILAPDSQIQDEVQIIRKTPKGFYILHYVIKKGDMGEKERQLWLDNLKKSEIKK